MALRTIRNITEIDRQPGDFTTASPVEVKDIIKSLNRKKVPGKYKINNKMLKELPYKGIVVITNIANSVMRPGHFPNNWKEAEVRE